MDIQLYNEQNNDLINPAFFTERLNTLNQQLPPLLDEFQQAYVFYNMAPGYGEYQNNFFNIRNNIIGVNAQLFMVTNGIENSINVINEKLTEINVSIEKEKTQNNILTRETSNIDNRIDSSKQRIDDSVETYKLKYINNFSIFIGIVIGILACKKIF